MFAGCMMKGVSIMVAPPGINLEFDFSKNSSALISNGMYAPTGWACPGGLDDADDLRGAQLPDTTLLGVVFLVSAVTARPDCSLIGSGTVGIGVRIVGSRIGVDGSRIGEVGFVRFLVRFQVFIMYSIYTCVHRGQGEIKIDRVGFESGFNLGHKSGIEVEDANRILVQGVMGSVVLKFV